MPKQSKYLDAMRLIGRAATAAEIAEVVTVHSPYRSEYSQPESSTLVSLRALARDGHVRCKDGLWEAAPAGVERMPVMVVRRGGKQRFYDIAPPIREMRQQIKELQDEVARLSKLVADGR